MRKAKTGISAANKSLWIDLGCGDSKQPGYIGIDRFVLPGVDIVCDLDLGIPLKSDSVEYLLASHSLEHLRDLPAAIGEVFRVCKDRALITIVAPYEATRLNQANPYHFQTWNEHTARFFTTENAPTIDPAAYRFPAAEYWGLQASDFTKSDVDFRCLRMEFAYLPPYRGLDEETKRTLRHSLSDVCDQMALHLMVVKSTITPEELSNRASTFEFRLTPAFEARRRAEADTSGQNLFSELAQLPTRLTAESTKANKEIGQLGKEIRGFLQRLDQLDRALVAQAQGSQILLERVDRMHREVVAAAQEGLGLAERIDHLDRARVATAQESRGLAERIDHLDRALVATAQESRGLAERIDHLDRALVATAQESRGLAERIDHLDRTLVAKTQETRQSLSELLSAERSLGERLTAINSGLTRRIQESRLVLRAFLSEKLDATAKQQSAQALVGDQILLHLVAERRSRTDHAFWPIKYLRRYRERGVDLRGEFGGEFTQLSQGPEARQLGHFKLQRGLFLQAGIARSYNVNVGPSPLRSIDIGVLAMFPPISHIAIADYELSGPSNGVICAGTLSIDHSCRTAPVRINAENVRCSDGTLALKLTPRQSVEHIGIQLLEWHRVSRFLHRVPELRLAYHCLYEGTGE